MALSPNINNREFDKFLEKSGLTSVNVNIVGNDSGAEPLYVLTAAQPLKTKVDTINSALYYTGETYDSDAADTDAVWRISRYSQSGNVTTLEYVNDGTFDQVWDNRYSLFTNLPFSNPFSVNFINSNDYVAIGNVSPLQFVNASTFSISAWVKPAVTTERIVFSKQGAGTTSGYKIYTQSNQIRLLLAGGTAAGDKIEIYSSANLNTTTWHHIVATYDGSVSSTGVRFYINGVLDPVVGYTTNTNALTGTIANAISAQISGRNGNTNNFQGTMNNISVWNKVLTAGDITSIYNAGNPADLLLHASVANLVGWWVCYDENDIANFPLFTDRTTNGIDGTGTNMSLSQINVDVP